MLGVGDRSFRSSIDRYEEVRLEVLLDKRLSQPPRRQAALDEVVAFTEQYKTFYRGWDVEYFYSWYKRESGQLSYTWVKNRLQDKGLVAKAAKKGKHRKRRDRMPMDGMMLHQEGSTLQWVANKMWDLIVTMDDATSDHYSMFFVGHEATDNSFKGVKEALLKRGLFCFLYTDQGSHYWYTPESGGRVGKEQLTQFGRAMKQLGIEMIPAYSPEARGRSERGFKIHKPPEMVAVVKLRHRWTLEMRQYAKLE